MRFSVFFILFAFLFFFAGAAAVPAAPADLKAEFSGGGVKVFWQHAGGAGVSFNVYRGGSVEDAEPIASVSENFFVDKSTRAGEKYVYLVTAADESGESNAVGSVAVTPLAPEEKAFSVELVEPAETTIDLEKTRQIDFALRIESGRFGELQGLKAVLVNDALGLSRELSFDPQKRLFFVSVPAPEREEEVFQTTYKIQVSASLAGRPFSESMDVGLTFVTKTQFDYWAFAQNIFTAFAPLFVLLFAAAPTSLFWWRWSLHKKAEREGMWLEYHKVKAERALVRIDYYKRNVKPEVFGSRDRELQAKQFALEERLGIKHEKGKDTPNRFFGYASSEIQEIMRLRIALGPLKKGETPESLKARLACQGRSQKVIEKVVELAFQK